MTRTDASQFRGAAWSQLQRSAAARRQVAQQHLKGLLEALIFASPEPLTARELARATKAPRLEVETLLGELRLEYKGRGLQLHQIASGYSFRTSTTYGPFVRELLGRKPMRMSRAQLETLAIISYRQPITRPEIDDIRGVDSGPVLRTLLDHDLIRIIGKKEDPGRPLLYSTTEKFLRLFGLESLAGLPTLREFTELSEDSRTVYEMELGEEAPVGAEDSPRPDAAAGGGAEPREDGATIEEACGDADAEPEPEPTEDERTEEVQLDAPPEGSFPRGSMEPEQEGSGQAGDGSFEPEQERDVAEDEDEDEDEDDDDDDEDDEDDDDEDDEDDEDDDDEDEDDEDDDEDTGAE